MKKIYIYKHTNLVNGKIYIGKSNNPKARWARHILDSKKNKVGSKQLLFHKAIAKYGSNNFIMEILAEYESNQEALDGEKYFIRTFNSNNIKIGYNLTSGGEGVAGYKRSKAECEAISKRNKGENNGQYGKLYSVEERTVLGRKISETKKKKIRITQTMSLETIEKIKKAVKEKSSQKLTDEQKDLIINLYNSGNFLKRQLAEQFCVEEKTIKYIIRYWDEVKNNKIKHLSKEQKNKIIELFNTKLYTKRQISNILQLELKKVKSTIIMHQKILKAHKIA